jgi:DNA-binding response OmpR family regulator
MPAQRVFIVDDDETFRMIARDALQKRGYAVEEAADGAQGMEGMRRSPPDLVVLDVMMPGVDGVSLCREIREDPALKDARILVVTALNDPKILQDALRFGADDCLVKPVDASALRAKVGKLLAPPPGGSSSSQASPK